ncbi:hypothetical protein ODU35_07215 [Streptococcus suis]|uniref:hypothetical protein n=1 Tax=Streptococcus suis TaxID=1307 RepID=UPI00209C1BD9|nr:hypothetical protein [Streptococcus suis]MCO8221076.1 hypothetical protein [Streptococcus suis]HEM3512551.1 hypothetical protein [Streptococcus suis]
MTKNELNEILDLCYIHLMVMKQHLSKTSEFDLDPINQDNLELINDLIEDIENGIKDGGLPELVVRYIYDDTEGLWAEIEPQFKKVGA